MHLRHLFPVVLCPVIACATSPDSTLDPSGANKNLPAQTAGENGNGTDSDATTPTSSGSDNQASDSTKDAGDPAAPGGSVPASGSYITGTLQASNAGSITLDPPATVEHYAQYGFFQCSTTAAQQGTANGVAIGWNDPSVPSVGTIQAAAQGNGVVVMVSRPTGEATSSIATITFTKADATKFQFEGEITNLTAPFDDMTVTASKLRFRCNL
jgi:hypothetical protein